MITSMTGFGRAELKQKEWEILAEVRSVNNRFFDVQVKLPKQYSHFEHEIKEIIKDYALRGRINIFVNLKLSNGEAVNGLRINDEAVSSYLRLLKKLKKRYKLSSRLKLDHLLAFQDVFTYEDDPQFKEEIWETIKNTLHEALKKFVEMRQNEGQELAKDLIHRIRLIEEKVAQIEKICESRHEEELDKLKQRVREIVEDENVDDTRLETEIALLINRMDVTEECVRFKSHNKVFLSALESEEPVGRKLNFLLQEMTREANTIGAKANNADISHLVVEIKEEVEKVREQVQNIE